MKIFVDFDDVLFNTRAYMDDLVVACAPLGVTPAQWYAAYQSRAGDVPGVHPPFTIAHFAPILAQRTGVDAAKLECAMMDVTERDLQRYVFADSVAFLRHFRREDVFVLTYGDDAFQRMRVAKSGIGEHIAEVCVTQSQKAEVLEDFLSAHAEVAPTDVVYLDDRAVYFGPVKERVPGVRTVLVARPEQRYSDAPTPACDCVVHDLSEPEQVVSCVRM